MVLVAAVAATVLITTAGNLQQQAEETGRQAEQEVASGFTVVNVMGDRSVDGNGGATQSNIEFLQIKMRLYAGSPAINMEDVVIEITDGTKANLNLTSTDIDVSDSQFAALCDADTYVAQNIRDPDGFYGDGASASADAIVSQGTLLKVVISLDSADTNMELAAQEHLSIKIIPKHGTPTYCYVTAPDVFQGRNVDLL
jgi:flagellin FlaB